jgi:hypothetical protein
LSMGQCPHCNHDLGEPIKTETKIIEDLPLTQEAQGYPIRY